MLQPKQMATLAGKVSGIADKAQALITESRNWLDAISTDKGRTQQWRNEQSAKHKASPEVAALVAQGELAYQAFQEELAFWRKPMFVLRDLARPQRSAGQDEQSRWGNALAEAQMFRDDPTGLQSLLDGALFDRDWRMVYACLLGKVDDQGRPLAGGTSGPFKGVPLRTLALPGVEDVETAALGAELAKLRLEQVALELATWQGNSGNWSKVNEDGTHTSLQIDSRRVRAMRNYENAKAQRQRLQKALSATDRWAAVEAER